MATKPKVSKYILMLLTAVFICFCAHCNDTKFLRMLVGFARCEIKQLYLAFIIQFNLQEIRANGELWEQFGVGSNQS